MKKVRKILRIIGAVLLALVVLATGYLFIGLNGHYIFNQRSEARPYKGHRMEATHADGVVRYEIGYFDGSVDYIEYNADRECVASEGIEPIHFDRDNMWGIWSYEQFVATYGEHHVDVGSMISQPSWFTDDGYLITLWRGGEKLSPLCIGNLGEVWFDDLLAQPE